MDAHALATEALNRTRFERQRQIIASLGVPAVFDAALEVDRRRRFLIERLRSAGAFGYVLAVSGGVDSFVSGRLGQTAIEEARAEGYAAEFVAMRLPYGSQNDETDAQHALALMHPDQTITVDIAPASDAIFSRVRASRQTSDWIADEDFVLGNIKARMRMVAQYTIANARRLLVIGTDHAAEALTGFFTKHGDGACDVAPLAGLTKRRVRAAALALGADPAIANKVPTADLEDKRPAVPDEEVLGISYDVIDDFLEGREVDIDAYRLIIERYDQTAHKRSLPFAPIPLEPTP